MKMSIIKKKNRIGFLSGRINKSNQRDTRISRDEFV